MMMLVLGANGSGKSAYAERVACSLCQGQGRLYYLATMLPFGSEGEQRVKRHRAQREGMGFFTVESPFGKVNSDAMDTVLLEDASNLLANLMFEQKTADGATAALAQIETLRTSCQHIIVVSISGFDANDGGDKETVAYIAALNTLNQQIAKRADVVIEMVSGLPAIQKGVSPCQS